MSRAGRYVGHKKGSKRARGVKKRGAGHKKGPKRAREGWRPGISVPGVPFLGTPGMIWAFFVPGVPVLGTPGTVRGQPDGNAVSANRREVQVRGRIGGKGLAGPGEGGGA